MGALTTNILCSLSNEYPEPSRRLKQMFVLFDKVVFLAQTSDDESHEQACRRIAEVAAQTEDEFRLLLTSKEFTGAIVEAENILSKKQLMRMILETTIGLRRHRESIRKQIGEKLSRVPELLLPLTQLPLPWRSVQE